MTLQLLFSLLTLCSILSLQAEEKSVLKLYDTQRIDRISKTVVTPTMIVINYTQRDSLEISHLALKTNRISTHYIIDKNGSIYETLHDKPKKVTTIDTNYLQARAWHAGHSFWQTDKQEIFDGNSHSISIFFVTEGTNNIESNYNIIPTDETTIWYDFSPEQIEAFASLSQQLKAQYNIENKDIVSRSEIAINPATQSLTNKVGIGPKFPWEKAAEKGIGLYHNLSEKELNTPCNNKLKDLQESLAAWGYSIAITEKDDNQTRQAIIQAQIHHDQSHIDGNIKSCRISHIMKALLAQHHSQKNNPA